MKSRAARLWDRRLAISSSGFVACLVALLISYLCPNTVGCFRTSTDGDQWFSSGAWLDAEAGQLTFRRFCLINVMFQPGMQWWAGRVFDGGCATVPQPPSGSWTTKKPLPLWPTTLLLAIIPSRRIFKRLRNAMSTPEGFCGVCGYDLRATPHRCPECGTAPALQRPA